MGAWDRVKGLERSNSGSVFFCYSFSLTISWLWELSKYEMTKPNRDIKTTKNRGIPEREKEKKREEKKKDAVAPCSGDSEQITNQLAPV